MFIEVNGRMFHWSEEGGLDPAAALAIHGWIISKAKAFQPKAALLQVGMDDLVQSGFLGALLAAKTFDPDKGASYITWASYKITSEMAKLCRCKVAEPLGDASDAMPAPADPPPALEEGRAKELMSCLGPSERRLLAHRYGLQGKSPETIKGLGLKYGLSSSAVTQRISRAVLRIRRNHAAK